MTTPPHDIDYKPRFAWSRSSYRRLVSCHVALIHLGMAAADSLDITVICGHRSDDEQDSLFLLGKSQLQAGQSKHNLTPSAAIDLAPYPIDWKDRERATLFAGFVLGIAWAAGIDCRWGGDWNSNWQVRDNSFDDLWHFELVGTIDELRG